MGKALSITLFVMTIVVGVGCGGGTVGTDQVLAEVASEPPPEVVQEEGDAALGPVEVDEEGTEFDPPVQPEQIPDGAWYCDMGTVHYARLEHGDGKCTRCGMNLVLKGGDPDSTVGG